MCSVWTSLILKKHAHLVCLFPTEAVPKRVLELMDVRGLTRENVASHLQVGIETPCMNTYFYACPSPILTYSYICYNVFVLPCYYHAISCWPI